MHCVPDTMLDGHIPSYDEFLLTRRKLMSQKLRRYFEML